MRHLRRLFVPDRAYKVLRHIRVTGSPPAGHKAGKVFRNRKFKLPAGEKYREYDIDPKPKAKGARRGPERVVVNENTGQAWYTPDHYDTFIPIGE